LSVNVSRLPQTISSFVVGYGTPSAGSHLRVIELSHPRQTIS
jgi:hypothetical protein